MEASGVGWLIIKVEFSYALQHASPCFCTRKSQLKSEYSFIDFCETVNLVFLCVQY